MWLQVLCTPEPSPAGPWRNKHPKSPWPLSRAFSWGCQGRRAELAQAPRQRNVHASLLFMISVCSEKMRNAHRSRMDPLETRRADTEPRLQAGSPASMPAFFLSFEGIDILPGIVPIPSNQQDFLPQRKVSIRYLATSSFSDLFASPKPLSPPPTA